MGPDKAAMRSMVLALGLAAGCGSADPGDGGDVGPFLDDPASARLWPPVVHTGHDGARAFLVPVSTDLSNHVGGAVTWSSADESVVQIEGVEPPPEAAQARGTWAMVTAAGPGEAEVSATIGGHTVTASVVVAGYSAAQVDAGEARYDASGTGARVACASCHQGGGGPDHTPTEMAYHDDAALLLVATEGRYPDVCATDEGEACACDAAGCEREPGYVLDVDHTWDLTADEQGGIVPYLRSLPPAGF